MKDHITVQGQDGTFAAYIARPRDRAGSGRCRSAGVVRGERRHSQGTAMNWRSKAYIAVAPDLFWRQEPGVDLNVTSEADWDHGLRLYSGL